jgi:hypothetical protein
MKRTLIALPALALLIGLLLFLLHRSGSPLSPTRIFREFETPPAAHAAGTAPAAPERDPALPELTGAIHFTILAGGRPVKDAKLFVQRTGTDEFMRDITPDEDGTRLLQGLPPVEFGISVSHPDYLMQAAEVHVESGKTQEVRFELIRGSRIFGTVTDAAGRPIPDTRVMLLSLDEERPRALSSTAVTTDERGRYELKRIPPTMVGVRFRHRKYLPQDKPPLTFTGPSDEYRVDAVLELGSALKGRVLDEQGKPIEGAHVLASNYETAMTDYSDQEGYFNLGGLIHRAANFEATKSGYGRVVRRNLPVDGPDVEIRLPKAGSLLGRVIAPEALPEFQIVLMRRDEELNQVVSAESRHFQKSPGNVFNLVDLAPGAYWVEIQVGGYEAIDRPQVMIVGGQITEGVSITLRKKN